MLSGLSKAITSNLRYNAVNDPHYWLGEIHCQLHPGWFVALSYNHPDDDNLPDLGLGPVRDS